MQIILLIISCIFALTFIITADGFTTEEEQKNNDWQGLPMFPMSLSSDEIGVNSLPSSIKLIQKSYCSDFDKNKFEILKFIGKLPTTNLSKTEIGDQLQYMITAKLISKTRDFKLLSGTLDTIESMYSTGPVDPRLIEPHIFCSGIINNVNGTFISTNGFKNKFLLDYDLNYFRYKINETFKELYKITLKQQIENNLPLSEINCKNEKHILTERPNGKLACVSYETSVILNWPEINGDVGSTPLGYSLSIADKWYDVEYEISDANIINMQKIEKTNSLLISIDAKKDGKIILDIPRELIDNIFMVHVDGIEWDDVSIIEKSLAVNFPKNTNTIEIFGALDL